MEAWSVRDATLEDGEAIAEAHVASILELGPACYGPEIVAEWGAPRDGSRYVEAVARGERLFVAESVDGAILGFSSAALADGGSLAVYVRGTAARRGVGSALLAAAERALRGMGAAVATIDASLVAASFYARHGFRSLGEDEHRLSSGGTMRCVRMAKAL